ncbi:MAG: hypothetical protein HYZ72_15200 [Deltaproteobacteria bacterium]|nr:hypothetical protein [Deltaproteobacteria bacterium]
MSRVAAHWSFVTTAADNPASSSVRCAHDAAKAVYEGAQYRDGLKRTVNTQQKMAA